MSYTWEQIRNQVRQFRSNLQTSYPIQVLAILKDFVVHNNVLYFLSNTCHPAIDACPSRNLLLYQIDLNQFDHLEHDDITTLLPFDIENKNTKDYLTAVNKLPLLDTCLLFKEYTTKDENNEHSNHFQRLLQVQGMVNFEIKGNVILFTFIDDIFVAELGKLPKLIPQQTLISQHKTIPNRSRSPPLPQSLPPSENSQPTHQPLPDEISVASRMDPKLGGRHHDLVAFVKERDIWVMDFDGHEAQITFSSLNSSDPTLKCGVAEYMMQEEFHRLSGYVWASPLGDSKRQEQILYLETSELQVEEIRISNNSDYKGTSSVIRYPRAGKPNVKSNIKLVEFEFEDRGAKHGGQLVLKHHAIKQLWNKNDIKLRFPWMEYIVRFDWLPDGQSIWLQLLSRDQQQTAVIKVPLSLFAATIDACTANDDDIEILWEEVNNYWVNVSDTYYFMKHSTTHQTVSFIWSSEKDDGYRHLYLIEKSSKQSSRRVTQLTHGEWCCLDRPLFVDESRSLIYFQAKIHVPLESHFYVISYEDSQIGKEPTLLTQLGFSHTVTMDSPDYFVDCFSTLHDPQVVMVQRLNHKQKTIDRHAALLMPVANKRQCETPPSPPSSMTLSNSSSSNICQQQMHDSDSVESNGEIFTFTTSDGIKLYGCLYKPQCYEPEKSYPTLLYIYGGPKTQLVTNEFRFPRMLRYLMSVYFGFAVVIIDSRGSSDRGLGFEAHIRYRLGTVEIKDQLEGLQFLHDTQFGAIGSEKKRPVIDLDRLAVTGWSYGGYLSLMAIAQYPDKFKMAIAGAPVTDWKLYDAAYTERYMGFPEENNDAYKKSNVLTYVDRFPNIEHRLLIAHGLIDENVHFENTKTLVEALVKQQKPHYLQVYPSEKHGLRHASVNEHFETLMFYWLKNYL
ncbi:MAG: hypothetical protein EXX96DRAFT_569098 [Benjaminiella poitrasii]|nr:MAG: hypothetical protein EXX96DRAFT_569098 [Benjaminiella poitrasii]